MTLKFQKASLHVEKTVINRLLDFSNVLDNFEINCMYRIISFKELLYRLQMIGIQVDILFQCAG
jgi:hypothetical protein